MKSGKPLQWLLHAFYNEKWLLSEQMGCDCGTNHPLLNLRMQPFVCRFISPFCDHHITSEVVFERLAGWPIIMYEQMKDIHNEAIIQKFLVSRDRGFDVGLNHEDVREHTRSYVERNGAELRRNAIRRISRSYGFFM